MKRSVLTVAVAGVMASGSVYAADSWRPMLDQGTKELSLSGQIELPELDEIDYDIDTSYGYFFADGWEVGVEVGASDFAGSDRVDVGVFTEYNFNRDKHWVPFVGAGVGVVSVDYGSNVGTSTPLNDEDGTFVDVEAGVKWFLRPYMAISTSIGFQIATEDVYATDDDIKDNLTKINLGLRFYF